MVTRFVTGIRDPQPSDRPRRSGVRFPVRDRRPRWFPVRRVPAQLHGTARALGRAIERSSQTRRREGEARRRTGPGPAYQVLRHTAVAFALVLAVVGCGTGGASFDPNSPCSTDGRFPGAYPDLESLVPRSLGGRPADRLDSGRSCTDAALATLKSHGVAELRFAGGLWEAGANSGTTLVVFGSPAPLEAAWIAEFYEVGARAGKKTEQIDSGPLTVEGQPGFRLDTLNDESYQTVIVWPHGGHVVAALVASSVREVNSRAAHETRVSAALAAFGASG
jgi:hypothetical protein